MVTTDELVSRLDDPDLRLFDARSLETYNGTAVSTYDPFLGHIQGAQSAPSAELFDADGKLLSQLALETRFEHLFAGSPSDQSIFYCGSGVRAIQSVFACVHIGLSEPRLYPGSWSEWITDPQRPVVTP
jgi:thiosulfate/3-mercaptopyruvate sulfurtransferase